MPARAVAQKQHHHRLSEFAQFKKIAKDYSMAIISGAPYTKNATHTISPIIGPKDTMGRQEKTQPLWL